MLSYMLATVYRRILHIFWGSAESNKKHTTDRKGLFIYIRLIRKTAPITVHYEQTYISEMIT